MAGDARQHGALPGHVDAAVPLGVGEGREVVDDHGIAPRGERREVGGAVDELRPAGEDRKGGLLPDMTRAMGEPRPGPEHDVAIRP
jgi:hypothetical protein